MAAREEGREDMRGVPHRGAAGGRQCARGGVGVGATRRSSSVRGGGRRGRSAERKQSGEVVPTSWPPARYSGDGASRSGKRGRRRRETRERGGG